MNIKLINRAAIRIDGGTQARIGINTEVVADYKAAYTEGKALPPIIVFFDGADFWLGDGFHRYHAQDDKASIQAEVRTGTKRDAILFAAGANANHGLPRSNEDKRRAVAIMLGDAEWTKLSDRDIAKHCSVSHTFVSNLRNPKPKQPPAPPAPRKQPDAPTPPAPAPTPTPEGTPPPAAAEPPADAGNVATVSTGEFVGMTLEDMADELQRTMAENVTLQAAITAASDDDLKGKVISLSKQLDLAQRRQNELQQAAKDREQDLQRLNRTLKRICAAVGEDDPSKVAATVEAFVRHSKVGA